MIAPGATSEENKELKLASPGAPDAAPGKGLSKALSGKSDNSVDDMLFGDPAPSAESGTGSSLPENPAVKSRDESNEKAVDTKEYKSNWGEEVGVSV